MKRIIYTAVGLAPFAPLMALAQITSSGGGGGGFESMLRNVLGFSNTVLIPFIIGIGFLFFVWGMFRYFIAGGADEGKREEGKNLMIYATLGFVLIIVFWGIVNLLAGSIFADGEMKVDDTLFPTGPKI